MLKPFPKITRASLSAWLRQHRQALRAAAGQLLKTPVASLLAVLAIAISLALPSTLYLLSTEVADIFDQWNSRQITLFLKLDQSEQAVQALAEQLEQREDIAAITTKTRSEALEYFNNDSNFADSVALLDENPFPAVITVTPADMLTTPASISALGEELAALPNVAEILLDQDWLKKIFTTIDSFRQFSLTVMICFALLVILVIHNSLRIEVLKKRDEIAVTKLVGGSNAFIQRPFLYQGMIYGLAGAALALLIVQLILMSLSARFASLSEVYSTLIELRLPLSFALLLILTATGLSLVSTSLSMKLQLRAIRP